MQSHKSFINKIYTAFFNAKPFRLLLLLLAIIFTFSGCTQTVSFRPTELTQTQTTNSKIININTASESELERLPHVGKALAARIIEHRTKYGRFRRPEHLMLVSGISDRRFRAIQPMLRIE